MTTSVPDLGQLTPDAKRALLAELLKQKAAKPQSHPLSFPQQRLWFVEQLEPGTALHNVPAATLAVGAIDLVVLRQALNALVRRHGVLRTTFELAGDEPVQVVAPSLDLGVEVVDLRDLAPPARDAAAQEAIRVEKERPFDLARGPLLRVTLVRLEEKRAVLVVVMHHIVTDGWSMGILVRELGALYASFARGEAPRLPELPIQYADFARWQRRELEGDKAKAQLAYWVNALRGAPPVLDLPMASPRPVAQSMAGATTSRRVSAGTHAALKALAHERDATLFMVLLGALQVLLRRYSGQDDIVVGTPIANRTKRELEGLIGFFVNTLALRTDLSGPISFHQVIQRVKEVALGAYANQDIPFERLVEALQPKRSLQYHPLFQVMFVLQNTPASVVEIEGLALQPMPMTGDVSSFDFTLNAAEDSEGLTLSLEFATELFDLPTAQRLLEHYTNLLDAVTRHPDAPVGDVSFLGADEAQRILAWSRTGEPCEWQGSVLRAFEAQVAQRPDAVAVESRGARLSYAELDAKSNKLARVLRRLGVARGDRVGLFADRGADTIVAILGVAKAGAAYVPLDPATPTERIASIFNDAAPRAVITSSALASRLPSGDYALLALDGDAASIDGEAGEPYGEPVDAALPAYVIYTSGTTGAPKGVVIPHGALAAYAHTGATAYGITPDDRVLQFASIGFDASVEEIFCSLTSGATLVVRHEGMIDSVAGFVQACADARITVLDLPTAFWHLLADGLTPEAWETLSRVRLVIIGGERALPEKLAAWSQATNGRCRVLNSYGPTETTVVATIADLTTHATDVKLPIGAPLAGVETFVLDGSMRLAPIGLPGELYIGGAGLALGYLNAPELTAQRFVARPAACGQGGLLYKTGDLVRYREDGLLDFIGRADGQVKIRGFRVELGEIEATLALQPGVRACLVALREDRPGEKRLVAYVIPSGARAPESAALRDALAKLLPMYMVPSAFVVMDAWPTTASGKVDRASLPRPDSDDDAREHTSDPPRTPGEQVLAAIWSDVLNVPRVGRDDDFFTLGGHSLLAMQLMARIRQATGVDLPVRALFEGPTLRAVAERIDVARRGGTVARRALAPAASGSAPTLSYAQMRMWLLHQIDPGAALYNVPAAVRVRGPLDLCALEASIEAIVARHEALRAVFPVVGGQPTVVIRPQTPLAVRRVSLADLGSEEREREAMRLATIESCAPFDLAAGPLLRVLVLELGAADSIVVLTMHHIVSDGWSMGVFVRELSALYAAHVDEGASPLAPLAVQYSDFAAWQRGFLEEGELESQLTYWREKLSGEIASLDLATGRARETTSAARGATFTASLSEATSDRLRAFARREGATPFIVALAAFKAVLHRHTGQTDLCIGTPIANRTEAALEDLIGFFVNTLVLRTSLAGTPTFRALVGRVRETTLEAFAHQDVPFQKLVEELAPERDLSRTPLFQAMFTLESGPSPSVDIAGVTMEVREVDLQIAKFDLTLTIQDAGGPLGASFEYDTSLFEEATIARLWESYATLLDDVLAHPDAPVASAALLSREQRERVLSWSTSGESEPWQGGVVRAFEANVAQRPDAVAVEWRGERLSYRALDARAVRLARALRRSGVVRGDRVGLFADRGVDAVVAILAVLKVGAAYVPLDPSTPVERVASIFANASPRVVVTSTDLASRLSASDHAIVLLDGDAGALDDEAAELSSEPLDPELPAYVIYTSGTTGVPKGVVVPHRALAAFATTAAAAYELTPADRLLQFASLGFDTSVEEIFCTLVAGATLVIRHEGMIDSVAGFVRACADARITVLDLPTAFWHLLADGLTADAWAALPHVRLVIIGGERARPEKLASWSSATDGRVQLLNTYGPTETTVVATIADITSHSTGQELTIGVPIAGAEAFVLDGAMQLVPIGVPGELHIGGVGLALGYLGAPELTAQRFVARPAECGPGGLLYKSGDVVRFREDGLLDFVGRVDEQVKIRGFRVELGEIETALAAHPAIASVVVVAREDSPGERRLVAYFVAADGDRPSAAELRAFVRARLPEYMVPSALVALDGLPLSSSGKIDRRALPLPDAASLANETEHVEPRSEVEATVARLFVEVLGVPRVGALDDFFLLGGHSLLATQLLSRLNEAMQIELSLRQLFGASTVERLAAAAEEALLDALEHMTDDDAARLLAHESNDGSKGTR